MGDIFVHEPFFLFIPLVVILFYESHQRCVVVCVYLGSPTSESYFDKMKVAESYSWLILLLTFIHV